MEAKFTVIKDKGKRISAKSHLDSIQKAENFPPNTVSAEKSLLHFNYDQVDISRIVEAYKTDKRLHKLKNFLVWKKKEMGNSRAFSLHCFAAEGDLNYFLQVEESFFQKFLEPRSGHSLFANMRIYGLPMCRAFTHFETDSEAKSGLYAFHVDSDVDSSDEDDDTVLVPSVQSLKDFAATHADSNIEFNIKISINAHSSVSINDGIGWSGLKAHSYETLFELPHFSKDITIIANNGAEIKAHKNILMVQSEAFVAMLNPENETAEAKSGRIVMDKNSEEGISLFVCSLYGLDIFKNISPQLAVELFQISNKYGVTLVEAHLQEIFLTKDMEWFKVEPLLELYFNVKNLENFGELRAHALTELCRFSKEDLKRSEYYNQLEWQVREELLLELWAWK